MTIKLFMINEGAIKPIQKPIFTTGDAYLIIDELEKKIYIWLGSKCSVDEKGTAAVEARRIDDGQVFNGSAKIITYDEGDESAELLSKLGNLKIVDKNLAKSMFKDVSTGEFAGQAEHVNAVYRVSSEEYEGINAMKFVQVPFEKNSLDSEDCFIADLGVDVWVWQGKDANVREKVKAMQFAREFDADRAGDQRPKVFMENDGDGEFLGIFEGKLPSQDRATVNLQAERFDIKTPKIEQPIIQTPKIETPRVESSTVNKVQYYDESQKAAPAPKADIHMKGGVMVQKGDSRIHCPKCGCVKRSLFREVEDRTNLINPYPIIYGKKWVCSQCGAEWRREDK